MATLFNNFRNEFSKQDNALVKIILINGVIFLTLLLLRVTLTLGQQQPLYDAITKFIQLPASLTELAYRPWTLLTYFFSHEDVFHILFNMLFLYWFGRLIDEYLGSHRVVALYILGGIAGGLTYIAIYNLSPYFHEQVAVSRMLGASASAFAVAVAASTLLPNYTFHLIFIGPIRIKYIAIFYIILSLAQSVGPNAGGNLAHLGGAVIGYLFIKLLQKGIDLGAPIYAIQRLRKRFAKKRTEIRVVKRPRTTQQQTAYRTGTTTSRFTGNVEIPDQEEVDLILDKISQSGYESLSKEEKQKLFRASQQK